MIDDIIDFPGIPKSVLVEEVIKNEKVIVVYGKFFEDVYSFNVVFLISKNAPENSYFLLREISDSRQNIWQYANESKNNYYKDSLLSRLIFCEELKKHIIMVASDNMLIKIVSIVEMIKPVPIFKNGEIIYFSKIKASSTAKIKKRLAAELGLIPLYSNEENEYWKKIKKLKEKKEDIRARQERELKEEKAKEKIIKRTKINARPTIIVFSSDNKKYYGTPVTEDEWMLLTHDSFAILVEEYDDENNTFKNPLEAFRVKKSVSGKCTKDCLKKNIFIEKKKDLEIPEFAIIDELDFEIQDDIISVVIIDKKILSIARDFMSEGNYLGIKLELGEKYQVIKKEKEEFLTIGELEPIDL